MTTRRRWPRYAGSRIVGPAHRPPPPMDRYEQRIAAFYAAFRELDAAAMQAAYAPDAQFHDPVFRLQGRDEIGAMWAMLCAATAKQGRDVWRLDVVGIRADASLGHAQWQARYRFPATGRLVLNRVDSDFRFDEQGLILTHRDRFDLWGWSRQALGPMGYAFGWTPWLSRQLRRRAAARLADYRTRRLPSRPAPPRS